MNKKPASSYKHVLYYENVFAYTSNLLHNLSSCPLNDPSLLGTLLLHDPHALGALQGRRIHQDLFLPARRLDDNLLLFRRRRRRCRRRLLYRDGRENLLACCRRAEQVLFPAHVHHLLGAGGAAGNADLLDLEKEKRLLI